MLVKLCYELKDAAGADIFNSTAKSNFIALKAKVHKLGINKLEIDK